MSLYEDYKKNIVPKLKEELGIKNIMAVPKIEKVMVTVGIGSRVTRGGKKDYSPIEADLARITGQKPIMRKATKSVSNFKLREGMPNGLVVTLRGQKMYDFLDRLINLALPRVRDFRGIPKHSFDGNGNYSLGLKEHSIFNEVKVEDIASIHGLQVTVKTTAKDDKSGRALLTAFGFPFKK